MCKTNANISVITSNLKGERMETIDYIAIVAGIITIISVCANIIQWRSQKGLITALKSRSQAAYNYFYNIAYRC